MARIVAKAFQLRKQMELKEGRRVPVVEVAERAGVERKALARLEDGDTVRFDGSFIARLCRFYGVGVGDLLEYEATDRAESSSVYNTDTTKAPGQVAAH
ncbi:MAG TPA: helix-turn-helix transcriptional regulator [Burkholderiales bacterium]|nr:helix-turn-helix transcriptional regulator [Burkholderiales bacterium]